MSKSAWIPFYASDWLNGTADMSLEEVGAYIQIVMMLYDNENFIELDRIDHPITGKLTSYNYRRLAKRLNSRSDKIKKIVEMLIKRGKLQNHGGYLTSPKVGKIMQEVEKKSKRSQEAAHKRWQVSSENVYDFNGRPMR